MPPWMLHPGLVTHLYRRSRHEDVDNFGGHENDVLAWQAMAVTVTDAFGEQGAMRGL
jgi:hypothetical protein